MTQISSQFTVVFKKVFPIFWLGFLSVFLVAFLSEGITEDKMQEVTPALAMIGGLAAFGYILNRCAVFGLVDEVWDCGNEILVRNRGKEDRIALSNCKDLRYRMVMNAPRITIRLRCPSNFGSKIAFVPPLRIFSFAMPPIAEDLVQRIQSASHESQ